MLTNETGLPATVMAVAEKLSESHPVMGEKEFSTTEVLKSVRQIVLKRRYSDQIREDINDTFPRWFGTAVHKLLEEESAGNPDFITETRLNYSGPDGFTFSGQFDVLDTKNNTIIDYKTSKIASIDSNRTLKDRKWLDQLYLYSFLIGETMGRPRPLRGQILAFATDWSKRQVKIKKGYPEHPIQILEWDLSDEGYLSYLIGRTADRMAEAYKLRNEPDERLPLCTYSDCWCTEDWAIMKPGAKKAVRVFSSEPEARAFYEEEDNQDLRIYHRVSDFKNCRDYCPVSGFCHQWQANMNTEEVKEDVTFDIPF